VTTLLSFVGGAGSTMEMADLIEAGGTVGAAAGSMFVFKGTCRSVLIGYTRPLTDAQGGA
jgi:cyclase